VFIGEYSYSLDDKGRVVLPSGFRADLKGTIYVVKGFEGCLRVYDEREWSIQQQRYAGLSDLNEKARKLKRLIFSGMNEVVPDRQGRIKISQALLSYAGIDQEKEVVIVGVDTHIEIWARQRWEQFINSYDQQIDVLAEDIDSDLREPGKK
jgi:MraZ protein